jgi:hypothetical protein
MKIIPESGDTTRSHPYRLGCDAAVFPCLPKIVFEPHEERESRMERDAGVVTVLVLREVDRAARVCARGARWLTVVVLTAMVAGAFVTAVVIARLGFSSWPRVISTVAVGGVVVGCLAVLIGYRSALRAAAALPSELPGSIERTLVRVGHSAATLREAKRSAVSPPWVGWAMQGWALRKLVHDLGAVWAPHARVVRVLNPAWVAACLAALAIAVVLAVGSVPAALLMR